MASSLALGWRQWLARGCPLRPSCALCGFAVVVLCALCGLCGFTVVVLCAPCALCGFAVAVLRALSGRSPNPCAILFQVTPAKKDGPRTFSSILSDPRSDGNARAVQFCRSHNRHVTPIGTAAAELSTLRPSAYTIFDACEMSQPTPTAYGASGDANPLE